ncbi:MAG TPA: discoidin domain-containing protein [Actinocrinis sp.]|nr:discoidin domain-containing protein [Actinocrinis sp.]
MFDIRAGSRTKRLLATLTAALVAAPVLTLAMTSGSAQAAGTPGATTPFTEYQAATSSSASTTGTVLPVDYQYGSLQAEATGRQADELSGLGQSVSFTLTAAANAVDFHYAIPDSAAGGGLTEPLSLYVNGTLTTALSLTSDYNWLYGVYPYSNTPSVAQPGGGNGGTAVPHDFYNDVRYKFGSTLAAGTVVKLQIDAGDDAPWYAINTADFETVGSAISQPSGYVNVTASPYNADATGANDATSAIQNAINAASSAGEGVYIPQGTFKITAPLNVNNVTVEGAGQWYTQLTGTNVEFNGNENPASTNVHVSNLSLYGDVSVRDNSNTEDAGFNGGFSNSSIENVWIQNEKVGIWVYGPATNLTIENVRIQDTTADGINLDAGGGAVTSVTVQNNFVRNTGDDGIALWSESYGDTNDTVTQNTVDSPGLANNMGIYGGGSGDQITNNLLQDTVQFGGGMEIAQNYGSIPFSGTLTISGNELVRTGQFDPGWDYGTGAIWIYPAQSSMSSTINITGNTILNSPYEAFMFQNSNAYSGSATLTAPSTGNSVTGVNITNNTVTNVGTFVFQDQAPGSATVSGTTATGVGDAGIFTCGSGFTLTQGSGNSGFSSTTCSMPSSSKLWAYPGVTTFDNAPIGTATATQQVGIMNTASVATTLGTITASSGFTVTKDPTYPCGSTLAAAAVTNTASWCMVDVSFTASKSGVTQGTLTINSNQPGPETVQLVGSTGTSAPDLALDEPVTASSATSGFPATNAVDGNPSTYWEGTDGAWPTTLSVNLGSSQALASTEIAIPPTWPTRTQTLSVLGSTNGSSYTTLVSSATYTWNPSTGDVVSISLPANTKEQYLELSFTANNVQNGAQVSEFEVLPGSGSGGTPPSSATLTASPSSLAFGSVNVGSSSAAQSVTIANTGTAAAAISSVAVGSGYSETNTCGSSLAAGASCTAQVTFKPTATGADSANLTVSSNASNSTLTVGLSGTGTSSTPATTNLALNQPVTASSATSGFPATNAVDGNTGTYWEGTDGAWPTALSVDLGTKDSISSVVVDLPSSWPTRTQTLSVLGSTNDSTWTTLVSSATYTWSSSNSNVVTISLPGGTSQRYVELSFTANNVQNGAQASELQVMGPANPNLALAKTVTASSATSGFPATNAVDGNTGTYWEGTDGSWPTTLSVNLGASATLGNVVVDLPSGWGTRTQTLSVLGSANGSTWTTLVSSATYTWNPGTGDTVSISLPSGTADQYLELSFTANNVQNGAQAAEVRVYG